MPPRTTTVTPDAPAKQDPVQEAAAEFERLTRAAIEAGLKLERRKNSLVEAQNAVEGAQSIFDDAMKARAEFLSHQMNAGAPGANPEAHVDR